ncbi:hypothetical protein LC085_07615 [Bacillus tianshenii]|uniref:hypothetical protein n=1 Tax=Sutcliffiella tianshenii TaxID=1463404 RepID=UPI001CD772E4|nr:hypothetical protein [Bacillus tianshenii]MCA1319779.1 hypothetical protein [Bacillus tianshenii]
MFQRKIQTVGSISEFMGRGKESISEAELVTIKKGNIAGASLGMSLLPLTVAPLLKVKPALAAGVEAVPVNATVAANGIYDTMLHAFDPLITLVQALAYPVAMVVVLGGALFIMIGNREKGFSMMSSAGLGYVLVTLTPMILNILVEAMKTAV